MKDINYVNLTILLIIWGFLAYHVRKWRLILDKQNSKLDELSKTKTKDLQLTAEEYYRTPTGECVMILEYFLAAVLTISLSAMYFSLK